MTNPFELVLELTLRRHISFDELVRRMMDAWLSHSGSSASAETLCRSVSDFLGINMLLAVIDTKSVEALDWHVHFIRRYAVPTTLFAASELQQDRSLREFPDPAIVNKHVIHVCQRAIANRKSVNEKIDVTVRDVRVVGSWLVIPDQSEAASWCIALAEVHSLSAIGLDVRFDDIDLAILQLLREGLPAREVGQMLELSHRTVEHRIEKMKARAGIRSIIPLLIGRY